MSNPKRLSVHSFSKILQQIYRCTSSTNKLYLSPNVRFSSNNKGKKLSHVAKTMRGRLKPPSPLPCNR